MEIEIARHGESVAPASRSRPNGGFAVPSTAAAVVPIVLQVALHRRVGFVTGVLSGMFGIGGAVITTPAIRALGATHVRGDRLDAAVDPAVVDLGLVALQPRAPHPRPDRGLDLGVRRARVGGRLAPVARSCRATATG